MKKFVILVAMVAAMAWAGSAQAAVGISMEFDGDFTPAIGINFQPSGWTVDLLARFARVDDVPPFQAGGTLFGAGIRLDKLMDETAPVTGLWGLCADFSSTSPEEGDSFTDFAVGAYIGGNAHVGSDNFHLVGHTGLKVFINDLGEESATDFGTFANLMFRWTGVLGQ